MERRMGDSSQRLPCCRAERNAAMDVCSLVSIGESRLVGVAGAV
jgi:hypothetical protein